MFIMDAPCFITEVAALQPQNVPFKLVDKISYCTNLELKGKIKKRDPRGIKQMWEAVKKKLPKNNFQILTKSEMSGLNKDKIHKISDRIQSRMKEFRDLVNPTVK